MYRLLLVLSFLVLTAKSARSAPPDIENYYSRQLMKNACGKGELARLRGETISLAGTRAPAQAWMLVREMLCGASAKSAQYVRANALISIKREDNTNTSDGQSATTTIERSSLAPIEGQAWETNVVSVDGAIRVLYDMGGVCAGSFDMRFDSKTWKISADGVYCD